MWGNKMDDMFSVRLGRINEIADVVDHILLPDGTPLPDETKAIIYNFLDRATGATIDMSTQVSIHSGDPTWKGKNVSRIISVIGVYGRRAEQLDPTYGYRDNLS